MITMRAVVPRMFPLLFGSCLCLQAADKKSAPAPSHALAGAPIPSAKSVASKVPEKGILGERDLILLAISSRSELERLRGAKAAATAQVRASHDLENPELRLAYSEQDDRKVDTPVSEQDSWTFMVRFRLPHPWERKARIQRSAAEVSLAESEYYEEDKVVRKVRDLYQELSIATAKLDALKRRKASFDSYRDWLESQQIPAAGIDLAAARVRVFEVLSEIEAAEAAVIASRDELAGYCGLADAKRINSTPKFRRVVDPSSLDADYLTRVALLYRTDVLSAQARLAIAHAQLAEAKAARIPFTTFIDAGASQADREAPSSREREEWFARVGVSIPLWDWIGLNKKHKVHEASEESAEREIELQKTSIRAEVAQAIKRLSAADSQLSKHDKVVASLKEEQKKSMADAQIAAGDVDAIVKTRRIEQQFQDLSAQMEVTRTVSLTSYYTAVIALEKALGVRLDRALADGADQLPAATSPASDTTTKKH